MLQTTFYKNDNFQGKYVQEWMDACIELMTSNIFVKTYKQSMFQSDNVTQHVEHNQNYFCMAIGRLSNRHTTTDMIKIIVPGPTYKLQKNYKKKEKDYKRKQNKNTCQQFMICIFGTRHITYKPYIFGIFYFSENMENKEKISQNSKP